MGKDDELGGSFYLYVNPEAERRKDVRKSPGSEIKDFATLRKSPRKKPVAEIFARVWALIDSSCEVIDLSRGGIRIRTKVNLSQGEEVGLHLLLPRKKDSIKQYAVIPTCQIVWVKSENEDEKPPYYMGLKIIHLTDRQAEIWQSFIEDLPEMTLDPN